MVNYANGKTYTKSSEVNYSRRGMSLEDDLNETNRHYLINDIAVVYKKPTPITITKVDYKSRASAKITEAFFQVPSTTDYNGLYKGKYIDFEAKETHSCTSLALSMIHPHQIEHLRRCIKHGGICFLIVRFAKLDKTYFIKATKIIDFVDNATRSSIPIKWFTENAIEIPYNLLTKVDYLKIVDQIIEEDKL